LQALDKRLILNPFISDLKSWLRKTFRIVLQALILFFITSFSYALYLRWFPPFTTPTIVMRAFEPKDSTKTWHGIDSRWKSYDNISDNVKLAVIASEDQAFPTHYGFDYEAIQKAMKHNFRSKRIRGGSTISQQVAKNIFLWQGRSWLRKGLEVYFTLLIETVWNKKRILQMYLNIAEMGNGIFGIEAASQRYFHKSAKELSPQQAALIAAILPNPREYSAAKPSGFVKRKQARILRAMQGIGGVHYLQQL
jgi:monofunctional biosynthetic peptidoglycan transglycosylase